MTYSFWYARQLVSDARKPHNVLGDLPAALQLLEVIAGKRD